MSSSDTSLVSPNIYFFSVELISRLLISTAISAAGRIQLAQSLLELLPIELGSIPEPEEKATEYLHYRQFFVVWDVLASVVECQSLDVPGLDRERKAVWLNRYRVRSIFYYYYNYKTRILIIFFCSF